MPANVFPSFGVYLSALPIGVCLFGAHFCFCLLSTGFKRPVGLAVGVIIVYTTSRLVNRYRITDLK
jgi:hypothetical protein